MTTLTPQQQWQAAVLDYARQVNRYVEQGQSQGWDGLEEPQLAATEHLLPALLEALQAANETNADDASHATLRTDWPPAHLPLVPLLDEQAQAISALALLDDGSLLARIGSSYERGRLVRIQGDQWHEVIGIDFFGRCPARRYFALARASGISVHDGWDGPQVARFDWPTGLEGLPEDAGFEALEQPATPTALIPFPDGQRVLLVSPDGIFVLAEDATTRLLPRPAEICKDLHKGTPVDDIALGLSMEHGAVSADGRWLAVGEQCGSHLVFDSTLQQVADVGPAGEYPHFALFNRRSDRLILNACHFYSGATLCVAVADLPGMQTDFYSEDQRTPVVQDGARVYAGVSRGDTFIVGDAYGYLRAFDEQGNERWQHHIGSTICAMDLSADGNTLAVSSHAGFVCLIDLDAGRPAWQIGTGEHHERQRWLFWKGQSKPLRW
ncbi:PQQ-like domain-containing protein [Pseudomonas flavescens]|uniref:PQQ-like domain-containing protein n=1 Tax=Phytopseudomonas flavescens TaxID=29435 RepID=A0A1G8IB39_9GAMM|nr:PQQ-binding-like beta-propeller repeat protein [Pseudomonas flavescens]SDI16072.1 PQQ-like domain-containing protein [Pseudomonas flavescens]